MRSLILMALPVVLLAQRSSPPGGAGQRVSTPTPMAAFDGELKRNRFGTWVVLEEDEKAWGAKVRAAQAEEPLASLELPLKVIEGGKRQDALARPLRDRYGWSSGAHWALVDAKGSVLAEGASEPTRAQLVAATEHAGVRSRAQELEEFLRRQPDHLEAQCALVKERLQLASRRTNRTLAEAPASPTLTSLSEEKDQAIWGPVLEPLSRLMQGGWVEASYDLGNALKGSEAARSPAMVNLLNAHRVDMEAAIRRRPSASGPWNLWLQASRICGGWPWVPLVSTLEPLPGTPAWEWPPLGVVREAAREAQGRGAWTRVREILEPSVQPLAMHLEDLSQGELRGAAETLKALLVPLLEALVSLGDLGAADQLVVSAGNHPMLADFPRRAADLATRLNREDLAARWAALTPKGR